MAVPAAPEPSDRSTIPRETASPGAGSTSSFHAAPEPTPSPPADNLAQAILQGPAADESSPTVISMARAKGATPDAQHAESLVGRRLGHFTLLESVGVGGMAAVIKAQDLDLGRTVALKILPPDMATDPENISRFKQEARAAARLDHENIARVYYCGEDQGLHFISFEFVEGENLRVRMEEQGGRLPVADSLHYLMQVTAGLSHAASRNVVHRDIKPSNIIITPDGKTKIVDMGLARNMDSRASNGQLTQSGMTLGTFDYISPEQAIEPRSADCRSDIYSLGCTFYHVLTGRTPVPEGTAAKKLHCHQHVAPLDPRELNPAIPDDLAAVLGKMMAKDPSHRYQLPDQLLQHLLLIAKEMNLPTISVNGASAHVSGYLERPLPAPPRLSPWWIATSVVALMIGLLAMSGGLGDNRQPLDPAPFWQNDKANKEAVGPTQLTKDNPSPTRETRFVSKGQQEAKNAQELVSLLRQPNVHIRLNAGVVYDLTKVSANAAETPEALFSGSDLVLECDRLIDRKPVVRIRAAAFDDGKSPRPGALTIRGPGDGSTAQVRLRGIRFEIIVDDHEQAQAGLSILNVDQLDVEECSFAPTLVKGFPQNGAAALAIHQSIIKNTAAEARIDRCWFSPGSVAIDLLKTGSQTVRTTQCAFGPQHSIVHADAQPDDVDDRKPLSVSFENCSMLMTRGAVVEIANQVPCQIAAGGCLFSNPELPETETTQAYLVRQMGAVASETRFEGLKLSNSPSTSPNGYHNVLAYTDGEHAYTFEECKKQMVPVEDSAARMLTKHPWAEEQPVKRLYDYPRQVKQVFALDLKQAILRLEPDKNRNILGTQHLPGMKIYDLSPFPTLVPDVRLAGNIKVWQPSFPIENKLPANVYRSLVKAIDDLENGDTLVIRHNGLLEIDPIEFKKADTAITVRPDEDYLPVLVPKPPSLKKDAAILKLYGGQLLLENLRFRLKPDRAPAIVTVPGGAQCTFRNCSITLEEGDDLSVVSLADPRGEMMMMGMTSPEKWPSPRVVFENSFIRGRGRLLAVHGSRPFDLRMKNSLAVLDGSLIAVEPSSIEIPEPSAAQVTFDHVTTYLTRHILSQRATDKRFDVKGLGLVQVQMQALHSLFVPADDQASLVYLDRLESMEQMEAVFQWRDCHHNLYGFKPDQLMLQLQPEDMDAAMLVERMVRDRWVGKWREADCAFGQVNFSVVPATRRFDGIKPGDFEIKSVLPPLKSDFPTDLGAPIEALRAVSFDE